MVLIFTNFIRLPISPAFINNSVSVTYFSVTNLNLRYDFQRIKPIAALRVLDELIGDK